MSSLVVETKEKEKKWTLKKLTEECKNNNIKILSLKEQDFNHETIHVYSKIKGICTLSFCENHWDKSFRSLIKTKNGFCKKHGQTGKPHLQYIKLLLEIKEKLPHINIKFEKNYNNELITKTDLIIYNCFICKTEVKRKFRNISIKMNRDIDIYSEVSWCCDDCCKGGKISRIVNNVANSNQIFIKDTPYYDDLYEIPLLINYITSNSRDCLKLKCSSNYSCPKCGKTHEYFERQAYNLNLEDYSNICNICCHPNDCECMENDPGFICTTCKKYYPDKKLAAHGCQICINCRYHYNDEDGNALNDHICHLLSRARRGDRKCKWLRKKRHNFKISDLNYEKIYFKLKRQRKMCLISKIPLSYIKFTNWRMSIERLDEDKGYLFDNTALICLEFQTAHRQWTVSKWNKFCQEYNPNRTVDIEKLKNEIEIAKKKPSQKGKRMTSKNKVYVNEDKNEMKCNTCKKIKNMKEDFSKAGRESYRCRLCIYEYNTRDKNLRERLILMLNTAKNNGKKNTRKLCTLTLYELFEIYLEQKGLCYVSFKKLQLNGNYQMSLERKNQNIGYVKDNCCLICLEFNVGEWDIFNKSDNTTEKTSGWNKEKIKYAVNCTKKYYAIVIQNWWRKKIINKIK
tara:strand:- start:1580 stop:3460 length:1881 start_codon:yes stop_codon:yes gene_type:complete